MHSNRLGCLTTTGIIASLITAFALVGVAFASGSQMFTAGLLNNENESGGSYGGVMSHAQIDDCKSCHTAPWETETMADRCASCHTDIAREMFDVAKLHGAIVAKNSTLACRDCHPEHRGSTASLTELGENIFPHDALGFSLNGHQLTSEREPFSCQDCHGADVEMFASSTCDSCHRQMDVVFTQTHVLSFGTDCLACHDGVDRFGNDFTHAAFSFKLVGKHAEASCTGCHLDAHDLAALQSAPQDCFSCHFAHDVHQARFGQDCASCHSPEGWKPANFDHNLSSFPLTGAHVDTECESCHTNGQYSGLSTSCVSCHAEPVEHLNQFGTDCAACHSTSAWSPAEFNGEHTFPLNHGEQGTVSCATCHPVSYTTYTCYGCHEHSESRIRSEHLEEGISDFQNCVECHANGREHDGEGGGDD